MGCGMSQVTLTQLDANFTPVGIEKFDTAFSVASMQINLLNTLMSQLMVPLQAFQRLTGLMPETSLGFGIAALLVACSADCDGDMISIGFRLLDSLPGFTIETTQLNPEVSECYSSWTSLAGSLDQCLKSLENSCKKIIESMEHVKQVPDLLLLMAFRDSWPITRHSELSQIAEENANKMDFAIETLGSLIKSVREIAYQLDYTLQQLSQENCISALNLLGQEARERSLVTPSLVHQEFKDRFNEYVGKLAKA